MKINCLAARFAVCRFRVGTPLPPLEQLSFYSLSSDAEGLRLVLKEEDMPKRIRGARRGWRALHFLDETDDSEQCLNLLYSRLHGEEIDSFVASTYDQSFLFVHDENLAQVMKVIDLFEYQWI